MSYTITHCWPAFTCLMELPRKLSEVAVYKTKLLLIFSIQILVLCNPIFIENSYKNHLSNSNWDEDRILVYNWGKVEKNIYKKSPLFTNNNSKAFSSFSSLEKFLRPKTTYFVNEQQAVAVGHIIIQLDNFKSNFHTTFFFYKYLRVLIWKRDGTEPP